MCVRTDIGLRHATRTRWTLRIRANRRKRGWG